MSGFGKSCSHAWQNFFSDISTFYYAHPTLINHYDTQEGDLLLRTLDIRCRRVVVSPTTTPGKVWLPAIISFTKGCQILENFSKNQTAYLLLRKVGLYVRELFACNKTTPSRTLTLALVPPSRGLRIFYIFTRPTATHSGSLLLHRCRAFLLPRTSEIRHLSMFLVLRAANNPKLSENQAARWYFAL